MSENTTVRRGIAASASQFRLSAIRQPWPIAHILAIRLPPAADNKPASVVQGGVSIVTGDVSNAVDSVRVREPDSAPPPHDAREVLAQRCVMFSSSFWRASGFLQLATSSLCLSE